MLDKKFNKTVWIYWAQGFESAPDVVKLIVAKNILENPNWNFELLDDSRIENILNLNEIIGVHWNQIPVAARSDIIRLNLLAKFGGVWLDATVVCRKPLDHWLHLVMKSGFFAFDRPGQFRLLSSWFLAAHPDNWLPKRWIQLINTVWSNNTVQEIKKNLLAHYPDLKEEKAPWLAASYWNKPSFLFYFWLHFSFSFLYKTAPGLRVVWEGTPKISADLPHFFAKGGFSQKSYQSMENEWMSVNSPVYKLTYKQSKKEIEHPVAFVIDKIVKDLKNASAFELAYIEETLGDVGLQRLLNSESCC